jgi:hypothetical protein
MKLTGKMDNASIYVPKVKYSGLDCLSVYQKSLDEVDFNASDPGDTVTVDPSVSSDEKRLSLT